MNGFAGLTYWCCPECGKRVVVEEGSLAAFVVSVWGWRGLSVWGMRSYERLVEAHEARHLGAGR